MFFAADQVHHRAADLRDFGVWHRGTGSVKTMGRIGLKAIIYFEVLTTIALSWDSRPSISFAPAPA